MEAGARWAGMGQDEMAWAGANVVGITDEALSFRAFRMLPAARILLHHGAPVEIGGRAFDLLYVLLRSRGALVAREDIIRHVWPTTTIEESNLRVQVASLRKILGEDRDLLKTVPGRGYLLAADIKLAAEEQRGMAGLGPKDARGLRALLHSVLEELRGLKRQNLSAR